MNTPAAALGPARGSRMAFSFSQALLFVALSALLRGVLLEKFGPIQGISTVTAWKLFAAGLHLDLLVAMLLFAPVTAWLAASPEAWLAKRWHQRLLIAGCWAWWFAILFVFVAEFFFFKEYRSRFNTVAVDYVHYWTEVSANIREMYPVGTIVTSCALGAAAVVFVCWQIATPTLGVPLARRVGGGFAWFGLAGLILVAVRPGEAQVSDERVVNELANAGLFSGYTAMVTRDLEYAAYYPTLDREEAWRAARAAVVTPGAALVADEHSLQHRVAGDTSKPKLNVCIMLEESLGSEFWGILNGRTHEKSLTPRLDEVSSHMGLLFDNLYADGNRTIRGVEAVLASFPPLPGDSIVARTRTHGVETLATLLGRDGYSRTFIYPGRGFFDDLRNFALNNGFDRFIEEKDFESPVFSTTWGVCNEDLYDRAIQEMRAAHASGRPFFVTTLSVSNHQPFTYPKGRIAAPPQMHSRKNAVRYVDYALGRFFDGVQKEPFWKDTIFVVVADHGARVYGSQTVPIRSYEIPLLIVGPAAVPQPQVNHALGCQLDVAPTVLGLIGRPHDTVFFGHDLQRTPAAQQRALLTHNRAIGIYRDGHLVTFDLNKRIDEFIGNPKGRTGLQAAAQLDLPAQALVREATALYQTADELYTHQRYQVENGAPLTAKAVANH